MSSTTSRRQWLAQAVAAPLVVGGTLAVAEAASGASGTGAMPAAATTTAGATPAPAGESASAPAPAAALDHRHTPKPLPFRPGELAGLSGRLVQSHWENNYGGAVKALDVMRGRLRAALADPDLPPYVYNELKREHLLRTGSVVLHELYFANLGAHAAPAAALRSRLASAFGSFDAWESEFRRIALGLGGGSGWVLLGHNPQLGMLENYWMADHATAPAGVVPLLVMDMYEHAYHIDYGAAAARYVDAFFANIRWDEVSRRLEAAHA